MKNLDKTINRLLLEVEKNININPVTKGFIDKLEQIITSQQEITNGLIKSKQRLKQSIDKLVNDIQFLGISSHSITVTDPDSKEIIISFEVKKTLLPEGQAELEKKLQETLGDLLSSIEISHLQIKTVIKL